MAKEKLSCADDCPIQRLCAEKYDTLDYAVAGVEGLQQQTEEMKPQTSSGIANVRKLENLRGLLLADIVGDFVDLADGLMDMSEDQSQLLAMITRDATVWRTLADNMKAHCEGPRQQKRFKLLGRQTLRCAYEPADVLDRYLFMQSYLIDNAATQDFGTGVEDGGLAGG